MRNLTMMNSSGHVTILWDEDADEKMIEVIEKKMAAGVAFYTLEPVAGGLAAPRRKKLTNAQQAPQNGQRALAIDDADLNALVESGDAQAVFGQKVPATKKPMPRAKKAKEVVEAAAAVAVAPRSGG